MQSKLPQHVFPAQHFASHEPPQSTSPSSPFFTPSPQYGTQQPTSLHRVAGGQLSKPQVNGHGEQSGSAVSMSPSQSSSMPLSQISGTQPLSASTRAPAIGPAVRAMDSGLPAAIQATIA